MEISPSEILKRYGGLHRTVHGAGYPVLNRIMTTCKELLTDRGYSNIEVTPDVLKSISKNEPVMKAEGVSLFIHSEDRVGVKFARMLCDECGDDKCIVVSIDGPTAFTKKECEKTRISFFLAKDLCYNVTKHCLVPKHEKTDTLPQGVVSENLPEILETDKVVQYYGWPVGSTIKITRVFGGHEPVVYFRVVVPGTS